MKNYLGKNTKYLYVVLALVVTDMVIAGFKMINNPTKAVRPIVENKLSLQISQNYSISALYKDLSQIDQTVSQDDQDQSLVNQAFKDKTRILSSPAAEKSRRLGLLNLASREINAATQLTQAQIKSLKADIQSARESLVSSKVTTTTLLTQYPSFNLLVSRIDLIKVSEDQRVGEILLNETRDKLQTAIMLTGRRGVGLTDFQADMTTLTSDILSAKSITTTVENSLIEAKNQQSLAGYNNKLKAPRLDINAAVNALKAIRSIIKNS